MPVTRSITTIPLYPVPGRCFSLEGDQRRFRGAYHTLVAGYA